MFKISQLVLLAVFAFFAVGAFAESAQGSEDKLVHLRARRELADDGEELFKGLDVSKYFDGLVDSASDVHSRVARRARPSSQFIQFVNAAAALGYRLLVTLWPYVKVIAKATIPYVIKVLKYVQRKL